MNPHKSTGHPARRGADDADISVPRLSESESRRIVGAVAQALPAWDQYTTQARLPVDPHWLDQGHRWDAYNNGHRAAQERRDPAVASAAWNTLERALIELSYATARLRRSWDVTPNLPFQDRRMGAFSGVDGQATGKSHVPGDRCAVDETTDGARSAHPVLTGRESAPPPGHVSDGETAVSCQPGSHGNDVLTGVRN